MGFLNSSVVSLSLGPLVNPRQPKLPRMYDSNIGVRSQVTLHTTFRRSSPAIHKG